MPSRLKIPGKKAEASLIPAWHPNFRNAALLPDVKVVRTTFFVNSVAVVVLCGLAVWLVRNESTLHDLKGQAAYWEQQVQSEKAGSDRAVILFRSFQEQEGYLSELRQFEAGKIAGSDMLVLFGANLPAHATLGGIDYSAGGIVLRGIISGTADQASGDVAAYLDALSHAPAFAGWFNKVALTSISRNASENGINFTIHLTLNPDFKGGGQ